MKLAANLTWLFTDLPLARRPAAAAAAGFEAVEVLFPYDVPAPALKAALAGAALPLALINTPVPDRAEGGLGYGAVPGAEARFREGFREAAAYARAAGAETVHVMSGKAAGAGARAVLIANLRGAAAEAGDLRLTIEPLNPGDAPGYFLNDFRLAAGIVAEAGLGNLGLQFDFYHAEAIHGDARALWTELAPLVSHVQIAGFPGRVAPDRGAGDVRVAFQALGRSGYAGVVAAEYGPQGPTAASLGWIPAARAAYQQGHLQERGEDQA